MHTTKANLQIQQCAQYQSELIFIAPQSNVAATRTALWTKNKKIKKYYSGCRKSILQSFIGRNWLRWEKKMWQNRFPEQTNEQVPRANKQNWQMTPRRRLCFADHVTFFPRALILLRLGGSPMVYTVKQSVFISPKVNYPSQTSATVPPKTDPPF